MLYKIIITKDGKHKKLIYEGEDKKHEKVISGQYFIRLSTSTKKSLPYLVTIKEWKPKKL